MFLVCLSIRQCETPTFKILPQVLSLLNFFFLTILKVSRLVEIVCKDTHAL